ncbi:MAG: hypothetical protein EOM91_04330 [Sphingobacteriia bacterium]|nr:hypothetical protein [Sphingobacteriia bacterium]NCC39629.1 hypothetical protein [Gammaproteobacteria bacterium]
MGNAYEGEETLVSRRLEVILRRPGAQEIACRTYAIGRQALLLEGVGLLFPTQGVEVTLAATSETPLTLTCRVEATAGPHAYLRFEPLTAAQQRRLDELLWPDWDGVNLLDGLILMSERYGASSLTEWLRLTDLLSVWHPQVTKRPR